MPCVLVIAGLGGPVLPRRRPASSTWSSSTRRRRSGWPTRSARWAGRGPRSSSATRKQMPPTSFAEPSSGDDDAVDFAETAVEDEESILSRVRAGAGAAAVAVVALPQPGRVADRVQQRRSTTRTGCRRSRRRRTGGASAEPDGRGVSLVRVPGTFHRSGAGRLLRTNPVEAKAIVAEIRRRFDAGAQVGRLDVVPSIGVVTFNAQQRAYIEALLRDADDDRLAEALDRTDGEGLFVKNLENVQGDERDVVFFSTGFSPNADGDAAAELRPAEPGRRRAAAQRRDHPRPAPGRRLLARSTRSSCGPRRRRRSASSTCAPTSTWPRRAPTCCRATPARRRWSTGTARRSRRRCASAGWSCAPTSGCRSSGSTCRSLDPSTRRRR